MFQAPVLGCAILVAISGCAMMSASGSASETKVELRASVPAVIQAAEAAFAELGITKAGTGMAPVTPVYGLTVGQAGSGSRVQVIANQNGEQTEIIVTTDTPKDPELESRLLGAIEEQL